MYYAEMNSLFETLKSILLFIY